MNDLYLSQFDPYAECITPQHPICKPKFPVFDMHTHMGNLVPGPGYAALYNTADYVEALQDAGVAHIVNLDGVWGNELDAMIRKTEGFENYITTFVWIDVSRIDDPDFKQWVRNHLMEAYRKGARGIKMWKVISLEYRDTYGRYIRTDDSRLDVVYQTAAELHMPILIHIADPVAFFKPADRHNERFEELNCHPDWQFGKPGKLCFEELMDMQDRMVENHPQTTFIIAHFGSYAENLKHVALRLDRYDNMYVDMAARVAELGRVPYSSKTFFETYSERIVFGTDCCPLDLGQHSIYYRFLETMDEYFPYQPNGELPGQGRWRIYGIGLSDEILRKVYYQNACRIMNMDEQQFLIQNK